MPEVRQAIESGRHEASRDRYQEGYRSWTYSLRGKTVDGRELRIVVAFDAEDDFLLLVTTIDLDAERRDE